MPTPKPAADTRAEEKSEEPAGERSETPWAAERRELVLGDPSEDAPAEGAEEWHPALARKAVSIRRRSLRPRISVQGGDESRKKLADLPRHAWPDTPAQLIVCTCKQCLGGSCGETKAN